MFLKILLLGPCRDNIIEYLLSFGDEVLHSEDKIQPSQLLEGNFDFIISYGYRFIIPENVVSSYKNRLINLHISYLPWNKGADPNFWSFIDDTPKGVTIHYIDEGLDTGDIIDQEEVVFLGNETLSSSYQKLIFEMEKLFVKAWPIIRNGKNKRNKQIGRGSYHRQKDKEDFLYLLTCGWDTPVSYLTHVVKRGETNERN